MVNIALKNSQGCEVKDLSGILQNVTTFPLVLDGNVCGIDCINIRIVKDSNAYVFAFEVPDKFKKSGLMSYFFCSCLIELLKNDSSVEVKLKLTGDSLQIYEKNGINIYEAYLNLKSFSVPTYRFDDRKWECTVTFDNDFSRHIDELNTLKDKAYEKIVSSLGRGD
ncbi:hypothetical protein [Streptococcus equi]|uniref:Uncharacterized protein n=1 Tax=Streptococcus equi subsp. zooepidemicus TaxID=40041 RepID=A0A7Z9D0D0_STRSZ|nr:hypothetical protein [Streptococcus equi]VEF05509.1 Uncharacterised protein [Streptococcus equi subsp. zooepidemicus]